MRSGRLEGGFDSTSHHAFELGFPVGKETVPVASLAIDGAIDVGGVKRGPDRFGLIAFIRTHETTAKVTESGNLLSGYRLGQ